MRRMILATLFLVCACATAKPVPRPLDPKTDKDFLAFYAALHDGHVIEARKIAVRAGIADHPEVVEAVIVEMIIEANKGMILVAQMIATEFELEPWRVKAFAEVTFETLLRGGKCEYAADAAFYFDLEKKFADQAISCAEKKSDAMYALLFACHRPGSSEVMARLSKTVLDGFATADAASHDYDRLAQAVVICPFDEGQLHYLLGMAFLDRRYDFDIAVLEKAKSLGFSWPYGEWYRKLYDSAVAEHEFGTAERLLVDPNFVHTPADELAFIDATVKFRRCDLAAIAAIRSKFPDATIEALFLDGRCFGMEFTGLEWYVPEDKSVWYFELSLRAQKFTLAGVIVRKFQLGRASFDRVTDAALAVKAYDAAVNLLPTDEDRRTYRNRVLQRILDADEEWFVTRYAVAMRGTYDQSDENWDGWIERAYLHALRHGAFELAADIADRHADKEFGRWGIQLAFDKACEAENAEEAGAIAKRWNLGKDANRKVALLRAKKQREAEKKRCQEDWSATGCK